MAISEETAREEILARSDIRPSQLAHIVLRTAQFAVMRDFYLAFLNARVAYENAFASFLRYDEEHHRVVIIAMPGLAPVQPRASGLEHYAFSYASLGGLLATYQRLKALGIRPDWCLNHGFTMSIYYRDPDGNQVETQFDTMACAQADAYMRSPYFDINPIGVDFDPEVLLARYLRGDPMGELIRFGSAPYPEGARHIRPGGVPDYDFDGALFASTSAPAG
ncbi:MULTISPECIES: VOC family protein [unclassified Novosphingobium]|uniref:VOC family protein n=1 Tax=unclassified Novosphingobium TaxID=2644732 RepID=UPI00146F3F6C|nr:MULTISPECIES: VOC family protein [unclassified Novosphingobium]NMN04599.1 catechol 2,3-dioxygenase-like lactoylglutathione lyase family enzyme [Novosphingobium sp. SG919]NMN85408.1 catechol 2,3-dioxygenase-like lactoylglutathione lyase family enzyme [Novosphingobium sp. SG916]